MVNMVISICNSVRITFVLHNRIHSGKNSCQIILTGRIQRKKSGTIKALLIDIYGKYILPVAYKKGICGWVTPPSGIRYICQLIGSLIYSVSICSITSAKSSENDS